MEGAAGDNVPIAANRTISFHLFSFLLRLSGRTPACLLPDLVGSGRPEKLSVFIEIIYESVTEAFGQ